MKHIYKKVIRKILIVILLMNMFLIFGAGCSHDWHCIEKEFETDGIFKFYYDKKEDNYALVGLTDEGEKQEKLFIPAHFNGKCVEQMYYNEKYNLVSCNFGNSAHRFAVEFTSVAEIYFPYTVKGLYSYQTGRLFKDKYIGTVYFCSVDEETVRCSVERYASYSYQYLLPEPAFDYIMKRYENEYYYDIKSLIKKANTVYKFNYEGEPNEGYFFINEFNAGGKIENTPYEPQREGYKFTGWYKEPECRNKWDFEKDTLPAAEYEEDGTIKFKETALYAGWNKK